MSWEDLAGRMDGWTKAEFLFLGCLATRMTCSTSGHPEVYGSIINFFEEMACFFQSVFFL